MYSLRHGIVIRHVYTVVQMPAVAGHGHHGRAETLVTKETPYLCHDDTALLEFFIGGVAPSRAFAVKVYQYPAALDDVAVGGGCLGRVYHLVALES